MFNKVLVNQFNELTVITTMGLVLIIELDWGSERLSP